MNLSLELPPAHAAALHILLERVPPKDVLWALTGSAGLRLQGVDVPVHDLDIQGSAANMDEIARRMADFVRQPPYHRESPQMISYYGVMEVSGIQVELMGDMQHHLSDGSWSPVFDIAAYLRWTVCAGQSVPVLDLACEAQAYEELDRMAKAAAIRAVLNRR